jgi:hypothetical protein
MKRNQKIKLDDLEKKQVFLVPDRFFEDLPAAIQKKVHVSGKSTSIFQLPWIKYGLSLASLVLLILVGYLFYNPGTSPEKPAYSLSEVSNEEIINYLGQTDLAQSELIDRAATINVSLHEEMLQEVEVTDDMILQEMASSAFQDTI